MEIRRLILFSSIHLISRKSLPLGREKQTWTWQRFYFFSTDWGKNHFFLFSSRLPCWLSVVLTIVFPWCHSVSFFFWCTVPHRKQLFDSSAGLSTTVPMPAISYYLRMWFSTVQSMHFPCTWLPGFLHFFYFGAGERTCLRLLVNTWSYSEVCCGLAPHTINWKNASSISGWLFSNELSQHNSSQIKVMTCYSD